MVVMLPLRNGYTPCMVVRIIDGTLWLRSNTLHYPLWDAGDIVPTIGYRGLIPPHSPDYALIVDNGCNNNRADSGYEIALRHRKSPHE